MDRKKVASVRKSRYVFEYRIALLGDKMSGKSSLLNRYTSDTFTHRYRPTIEEHVTHTVEHKGSICVCLFIDTSGSNDFPAMRRLTITKCNAFFVTYAINDRKTFDTCKIILGEITDVKSGSEELKIILLGTKTDLKEERQVDYEEGEALLDELNERNIKARFFEVTSKEGSNVDISFMSLLDLYVKHDKVSGRGQSFSRTFSRRKSKSGKNIQRQQIIQQKSQDSFSNDYDLDKKSLDNKGNKFDNKNSLSDNDSLDCDKNPSSINGNDSDTTLKENSSAETNQQVILDKDTVARAIAANNTNIKNDDENHTIGKGIPGNKEEEEECFSDSEIEVRHSEVDSKEDVLQLRCNSASPNLAHRIRKPFMKGVHPLHFVQRTFDSVQRILGSHDSPTDGVHRSKSVISNPIPIARKTKSSTSW